MALQLTQNLGQIPVSALLPVVHLSWQERQRSRLAVVLSDGRSAAVILPRGEFMRDGDVLACPQGTRVRVHSAVEDVLEIRAQSPFALMRVVYHLANRHAAAMLTADAVCIEPDPILGELARQLGASVVPVQRVFEPERGAYQAVLSHRHDGAHHHDHHHGHHGDDLDDQDRHFGNIGEALSKAAHAAR